MEVALQLSHLQVAEMSEGSFNPCFYGSGSTAKELKPQSFHTMSFNPCFYGSGSTALDYLSPPVLRPQFQSLFLWKWLYSNRYGDYGKGAEDVSILVFMEV